MACKAFISPSSPGIFPVLPAPFKQGHSNFKHDMICLSCLSGIHDNLSRSTLSIRL